MSGCSKARKGGSGCDDFTGSWELVCPSLLRAAQGHLPRRNLIMEMGGGSRRSRELFKPGDIYVYIWLLYLLWNFRNIITTTSHVTFIQITCSNLFHGALSWCNAKNCRPNCSLYWTPTNYLAFQSFYHYYLQENTRYKFYVRPLFSWRVENGKAYNTPGHEFIRLARFDAGSKEARRLVWDVAFSQI